MKLVLWGYKSKAAAFYRALYYTPLTSLEVDIRKSQERLGLLLKLKAPERVVAPVQSALLDFQRVAKMIRDGRQAEVDAEYKEKKRILRDEVTCKVSGLTPNHGLDCTARCYEVVGLPVPEDTKW